ncbi:hypothetical protein CDL15_Pgr006711 [Punica granatum]|uniref:PRP1 splicing factor N-terminal domain-containing protein n=1 Tax=Punica granatum TaxID=22663 RepID=A0A218X843_PUNGR|nr:hypothetical protein CDL15_Pgr006711 [Punica granatum]
MRLLLLVDSLPKGQGYGKQAGGDGEPEFDKDDYDEDDKEADAVWEAIDKRMDSQRKDKREARLKQEIEKYRASNQQMRTRMANSLHPGKNDAAKDGPRKSLHTLPLPSDYTSFINALCSRPVILTKTLCYDTLSQIRSSESEHSIAQVAIDDTYEIIRLMEEKLSWWPRICAAKASVIGHCTESVGHVGLSLEKVTEARR